MRKMCQFQNNLSNAKWRSKLPQNKNKNLETFEFYENLVDRAFERSLRAKNKVVTNAEEIVSRKTKVNHVCNRWQKQKCYAVAAMSSNLIDVENNYLHSLDFDEYAVQGVKRKRNRRKTSSVHFRTFLA
ncbi:unnamed protein product [Clavelina lepadiformis]|uniref:Transposase n=1 Tax=Clavelina lepadiformis TaxID=159417 RepID=A0ABP0H1G2_CLALP